MLLLELIRKLGRSGRVGYELRFTDDNEKESMKDVPEKLKVRIHVCSQCGLILNLDHVSAILIGNRGKPIVPADCRELTPVESIQKELMEAGRFSLQ